MCDRYKGGAVLAAPPLLFLYFQELENALCDFHPKKSVPVLVLRLAPRERWLAAGFAAKRDGRSHRHKRLALVNNRTVSFICGRGGEASAYC